MCNVMLTMSYVVQAAMKVARTLPERMAELASLTTMAWLLAPSLTLQP